MNKSEALKRVNTLRSELAELEKVINCPEKITDRVKTFEDACDITGDSKTLLFPCPTNKIQERLNYDYMLYVITKALNESWKLDWNDSSQAKWYPWMEYNKASSAFRFYDSDDRNTGATAGSGVRLSTRELSDYFGKQFETLISKHLLTLQ